MQVWSLHLNQPCCHLLHLGKQEVKVANVAAAHSKTKRTEGMFGPPRPPQHSIGPSFGPPRPSTSTAAMPAGTQPHSTGWKGVDGDGNDGLVGPARPVNLSLGDDDDNDGDEQAAGPPRPPAGRCWCEIHAQNCMQRQRVTGLLSVLCSHSRPGCNKLTFRMQYLPGLCAVPATPGLSHISSCYTCNGSG